MQMQVQENLLKAQDILIILILENIFFLMFISVEYVNKVYSMYDGENVEVHVQ